MTSFIKTDDLFTFLIHITLTAGETHAQVLRITWQHDTRVEQITGTDAKDAASEQPYGSQAVRRQIHLNVLLPQQLFSW